MSGKNISFDEKKKKSKTLNFTKKKSNQHR